MPRDADPPDRASAPNPAEGIARSNKTLRNVSSAWVKEQKVEVADGTIAARLVTLEVTFVLDD
jgi:flavin-binding protein dodecin